MSDRVRTAVTDVPVPPTPGDVVLGDCVAVMAEMREHSVDAIVTDPPYKLSFMGKDWDEEHSVVPVKTLLFRAWFAGLVAGEAAFRTHKERGGEYYACAFSVKMRADEAPLLRALARRTQAGAVSILAPESSGLSDNPMASWQVQNREDCWKIAALLDGTPLYAKKQREYNLWRRALETWTKQPRGNRWHGPSDKSAMASLYEEMKTLRPYDHDLAESDFDPLAGSVYADHYTWAHEALRTLKPGGYLLAFGGTRTHHRLMVALEDAGFEIRDTVLELGREVQMLAWITGQGFPKSLNVECRCESKQATERDMRHLPSKNVSPPLNSQDQQGQVLFDSLPQQGASESGAPPRYGNEGTEESGMEGGRDLQENEGQLHRPEIRSLPGEVPRHVTNGRLRDGAQTSSSGGAQALSSTDRSRPPSGSRSKKQPLLESRPLQEQLGAQESGSRCEACGGIKGYEGWGTALKPAWEIIILCRKPLSEQNVAANVLKHGTGGINVDGCRIGTTKDVPASPSRTAGSSLSGSVDGTLRNETGEEGGHNPNLGRWPANVILSHSAGCQMVGRKQVKSGTAVGGPHNASGTNAIYATMGRKPDQPDCTYADTDGPESVEDWRCQDDCAVLLLDEQSGNRPGMRTQQGFADERHGTSTIFRSVRPGRQEGDVRVGFNDSGGASRFFYTAKAPSVERWGYCTPCAVVVRPHEKDAHAEGFCISCTVLVDKNDRPTHGHSLHPKGLESHPTVKPLALMRYLIRLVTPQGGLLCDPFCGSGSTLVAAQHEGIQVMGIEKDHASYMTARARLADARRKAVL